MAIKRYDNPRYILMNRRKLLFFVVIPVITLLIALLAVVLHYRDLLFDTAGGETFKGTVTAASIDCSNTGKDSSLTIDDKIVSLQPSHSKSETDYGYTDLNLCGLYADSNSYGTVNKREGDSRNGSWLIGRKVEVRADKIDVNHYTLKGSSDFYVRGD